MSLGGIVGGVVGGVIGFVVGGPAGAAFGFSLGFGIGSYIDPLRPDSPSPGSPNLDMTINTADEGGLIPEILGTVKLNGNIVWHQGTPRVVEIKESSGGGGGGKGGGGGSTEYTAGYKYYMTWCVEFCMGEVDSIYTIFENDEIVWSSLEGLNRPVSGGKETIVVDAEKSIDFYFGTDDQAPNSYLAGLSDGPTWNIPRRHRCWMVLKDYYIGDYARCPSIQICVKKTPDIPALTGAYMAPWVYDYNPMWAKYYIMESLGEIDVTDVIDVDSWDEDAATLFNEGRGLSIKFDSQQTIREWYEQIDAHIFGGLRQGVDGKFESKLLRGAESTGDMLSLTPEDDCVDLPQLSRSTWLNIINEVKIQHPLRSFEEACECGTCNISATTHQVDLGESLNLSVVCGSGDANKCNFSWELSGPGSISSSIGDSTTYTAPLGNSNCEITRVKLYCNGYHRDTWLISTTDYDNVGVAYLHVNLTDETTSATCTPWWAYWPGNKDCAETYCCCWCHYRGFNCQGVATSYYQGWPCGYRAKSGNTPAQLCGDNIPSGSSNCYADPAFIPCEIFLNRGDLFDFRGECAQCADEGVSCCPADLILGG